MIGALKIENLGQGCMGGLPCHIDRFRVEGGWIYHTTTSEWIYPNDNRPSYEKRVTHQTYVPDNPDATESRCEEA